MRKLRLESLSARRSGRPPYCPDAGDIIWLQFSPQAGREQAGRRPALALSPRRYNERSRLCIVCPMTNQAKGYPFEVSAPAAGEFSTILADQVKSHSWQDRQSEFILRVEDDLLMEVRAKIRALLSL
jgi:mRNA interferase MazF